MNLEKKLTAFGIKDLDGFTVSEVTFSHLHLLCSDSAVSFSGFPNKNIARLILLNISVTVASRERIFSKLELFKNYMRSTMIQDRLSNLDILSTEKDIA